MSVDQTPEAHHYDPLLDERPRRRKKMNVGLVVGIIMSVIVHVALVLYIWKVKFEQKVLVQEDTAVQVDLQKLAPPPPPPPPPPPAQATPHPPPPIQPRPTPTPPPDIQTPSLPIPPVKNPQPESVGPPQPVPPTPPAPPAPPAAPPVITQADFLAKPNGDDMAQYYPDRAQRMEKAGKASIHCIVTVKGTLTGCTVVEGSENPPNWDFGQQSLKLAHLFKVRPATVNGKPVEASITIPIRWELAD